MGPVRRETDRRSDFELGRQKRETRNEQIINWLRVATLFAALTMGIVLNLLRGNRRRAADAASVVEAVMILLSIALFFYLRANPPYLWWRKYAITAFELLLFTVLSGSANQIGGMPPASPTTLMMLVILTSGLRYSTRVVAFAGICAIALHTSLAVTGLDPIARVPVLVFGSLQLATTSVAVGYLVASLLRLHRASVSKERLRRFMAPEVVDEIMRAPEVTLGAVEREVTVLFSDLTDFTKMSSSMSPQEVVDLLNDYFPVMADIVFRYQGTLEKYIGDALLAIWGVPLRRPDDADRAVRAAAEMQQAIERLNRSWAERGRQTVQAHIGIHSGKVAAGNIGSDEYLQYATIGDTTNVASRICSAAGSGEILISASTVEKFRDSLVPLDRLPPARVKGKDEPLELYRVQREAFEVSVV